MSTESRRAVRRSKRAGLPLILAGAAASLVLAAGFSPTLAAFMASIANDTNTAGTGGGIVMQESTGANGAGTVCVSSSAASNAATCSTINKYGGALDMVPGRTVTSNVFIKNTGTSPAASFTLAPGTCAQSSNGSPAGSATDLCAKMNLVVRSGSTQIYSGTLAGFTASQNILTALSKTSVAANEEIPFTFAVTLDSAVGNTYTNLKVSQPMTWSFSS